MRSHAKFGRRKIIPQVRQQRFADFDKLLAGDHLRCPHRLIMSRYREPYDPITTATEAARKRVVWREVRIITLPPAQ
jgi:hypothetical protein